jgi:CHAT domain-containing protein/predicted negative regulator of RcsB-dependent stress response
MITRQVFILLSGYRDQSHARRALACFLGLLFSVGLMHGAKTRTLSQTVQKSLGVRWLEEGKPIERELSGGESHSYQLNVATGQYARVIVEQKGIDVVVSVFGPDGKLITAVDNPNGSQGAETVHITAEATGIYRLEVTSFEKLARLGSYQAKLAELRPATTADQKRLAARRAFDEGETLQNQNTRDSLPTALKKYEEALALYRAIEDPIEQFTVLIGMGNTNRLLNDSPKALACFDQALRIAQALGDQFRQGRALELTGDVYAGSGEFENTLRSYEEALQLYQATGDQRNEAKMLNSIGSIYSNLGEPEKARECFGRVVRLYEILEDKNGEADTLESIGYSYHLQGDPPKTLEYYTRALPVWRALKNKQKEAANQSLIAAEFARIHERQKALANAEQALNLIQTPDVDKKTAAIVLANVGHAYYKLGEFEKALTFYDEPLRLWQSQGSKRNEAIARMHIATALRDLGRLEEAKVNIEKSIALMEFIRDHAGNAAQQASFVANFFEFYEFYIDLLMRLHAANPQAANDQAALAFTEKVKLRSLVELLMQARVELRGGVDVARNSRYAALTAPQSLSISEMQQQLLDDNTILLEFKLGQDRSYLWTVTWDGVHSYQLPSKAEIEAQARRVYQLLTARQPASNLTVGQQRAREKAADLQYQTQASVLSNMLLAPVAGQLGTKRLVIVADGALQYLPFAVLPAPAMPETKAGPRPLILDHEIVSLPSASVLAALRRELADRRPAPKTVAVLADPVFEMDDARVKLRLTSAQAGVAASASTSTLNRAVRSVRGDGESVKLQRLLFSRDEAEAILSLTPNQSKLEALDFRANRKQAMSDELSQYRIVHFSTHGLLDSRHPELSGLVLSLVDEAGRPQEGFLRLQEIYTLRLNADLVVLSACQTGLGKEVRGEGLIGLVRGFMYAGAPRVMASMWEVDDAATAQLMKRFYRGVLQEKLTPAAALRAAQIEMLRKSHWQSPYYWGAFVLQGEWR